MTCVLRLSSEPRPPPGMATVTSLARTHMCTPAHRSTHVHPHVSTRAHTHHCLDAACAWSVLENPRFQCRSSGPFTVLGSEGQWRSVPGWGKSLGTSRVPPPPVPLALAPGVLAAAGPSQPAREGAPGRGHLLAVQLIDLGGKPSARLSVFVIHGSKNSWETVTETRLCNDFSK